MPRRSLGRWRAETTWQKRYPTMELKELIGNRMQDALASGKFAGCQDIITLYRGGSFPSCLLPALVHFLEGWGDSLVGSNGKAALVKYELAQQVLSRLSPTGAGDVIWGNTLSKSLAEKMNKLREK